MRVLAAALLSACASCSLLVDTSNLSSDVGALGEGGAADVGPGTDASQPATDASVDAGDAATSGCPSGRGPAMVRVTDVAGKPFCIDATEVTDKQLNVFLAEPKTNLPSPPLTCSSKSSFGGAPRANDDLPAVTVDWCDAAMFCKWAGKRLCGSRNGTLITDFAPANDAATSEWFAACSHSGALAYPYGSTADPLRCNGCDRTSSCPSGASPLVPVGSLAQCEGGYAGVFDMVGNVAEWEDNCDGNQCPPRGGARSGPLGAVACALSGVPSVSAKMATSDSVGIRCCADAK